MGTRAKADPAERRLAAILSADVVGYSRLIAADDAGTARKIAERREQVAELVGRYGGRLADFTGDNWLAEFPSALAATECALAVQREMLEQNAELPQERRMQFRIGIHLGDVLIEDGRLYGDGVNIAARLESIADPGGVCVSAVVRDQVRNKLDLPLEDLGERELKNVPEPVRVFGLSVGDAPTASEAAFELPERPSVVVLPFENRSPEADQEYFADGITEDLITDLSKLPGMLVIARNSAFSYKGRPINVQQVSRDLGVRYVVEGSVRRSGDRVRITAQLIDASNGYHRWAERYDRTLADVFAVQDEVTSEIVSALRVELSDGDFARAAAPPTTSLEAYDLYMRASTYLRRFQRDALLHGRTLLERALELDPGFALAKQALAASYAMEFAFMWTDDLDAAERAETLAREAIALDPTEPESHLCLTRILWFLGRPEEMLESARSTLELSPGSSDAHSMLGMALRANGRVEESIAPTRLAVRLDPNDASARTELAALCYQIGRPDEGVEEGRRAVALAPDFVPGHLNLAACYMRLGRAAEARAGVAEILRLSPEYSIGEVRRRIRGLVTREEFFADLREAGLPD